MNDEILRLARLVGLLFVTATIMLASSQTDSNSSPFFVEYSNYTSLLNDTIRRYRPVKPYIFAKFNFSGWLSTWVYSQRLQHIDDSCLSKLDYGSVTQAWNKTSDTNKVFFVYVEYTLVSYEMDTCQFAQDEFSPKCLAYLGVQTNRTQINANSTPENFTIRYPLNEIILVKCARVV